MLFDDLDCASSHHVSLLPFNFERKKIHRPKLWDKLPPHREGTWRERIYGWQKKEPEFQLKQLFGLF